MDLRKTIGVPAGCCKCLRVRPPGLGILDDNDGLVDGTGKSHRDNAANLDPGRVETFNVRPRKQPSIRESTGPKAGATIKELAAEIVFHRAGTCPCVLKLSEHRRGKKRTRPETHCRAEGDRDTWVSTSCDEKNFEPRKFGFSPRPLFKKKSY